MASQDELRPAAASTKAPASGVSLPHPTLSFAPLPLLSEPASASMESPLILKFRPDHPGSTHISDGSTDKTLYLVDTEIIQETPTKKRTVTTVQRVTPPAIIAQFQWKELFTSDTVALTREIAIDIEGKEGTGLRKGGEGLITIPAGSWLKKSSVPFKNTVTYKDPKRKAYKWKGFTPGLSLELYSSEKPKRPLVTFQKGNSTVGTPINLPSGARSSARLIIDGALVRDAMVDEVVVAFLYLEKIRRERDDDDFKVSQKPPAKFHRQSSSARPQAADDDSTGLISK